MSELTPQALEAIKRVVHEVHEERSAIEEKTHKTHHEWIELQIESQKNRNEMYKTVVNTAIGWSIPAILGGLWYYVQHFFQTGKP